MGWRKTNVAATIQQVTEEQRKEMAARMRVLMERRGLTNDALGHQAGVAEKTISRMVNAKHEPRYGTIERVAEALGVSAAELAGTTERETPDLLGQLNGGDALTRLERIETAVAQLSERLETISVEAVSELAERQERMLALLQTLAASEVLETIAAALDTLEAPPKQQPARTQRRRPGA